MRIFVVCPMDSLHGKRWVERLILKGNRIIVLDITDVSRRILLDNVEVIGIPNSRLDRLPVLSYLRKFVNARKIVRQVERDFKPDLISLNWLFSPISLAVAVFASKPIVSTPWGSDLLIPSIDRKQRVRRFLHRLQIGCVVKRTSSFTCDAPHMKEQLVKLGANPALVEIIYFGIDVNYFSPLKKSEEFRQKFINGSRNIIVTSNRQLAEVYRIDLLLTAVSELDLELQDQLVLLIASAGPQRDSLLQYAYDLKIGEFTRFLGRLSDEDMSTLVASSDLYVSTSPTDGGIASSVAEAMACEVPVITSDFGDNRHWVTESGAGLTFKVNSHSELKSNLEKLIPSRDLRISMGQLGREKIKIDNNSDVETEKLERFFQETLKIN